MISIFNFKDYRRFILAHFDEMPMRGYGQSVRLAEHLQVHPTLVSQVFKGLKSFTHEQAALVAEFLGLSYEETDCLLVLVQLDRAGNESLKKNLQRQLTQLKSNHRELSKHLKSDATLSEEKRAIFYSDWIYSAVRQFSAIANGCTVDDIASRFDLPAKRAREIITFLLEAGLLYEEAKLFKTAVGGTHLESTSPWLRVHHINWRMKAIECLAKEEPAQLHYTCPMTVSVSDATKIREMIVKFLQAVDKVIDKSPSEELRCLNIDWFKL